jgi:hypothetical protein
VLGFHGAHCDGNTVYRRLRHHPRRSAVRCMLNGRLYGASSTSSGSSSCSYLNQP